MIADDVAAMFQDLDGYSRYEEALQVWGHERRVAHAASTADYRRRNPEKVKASQKAYRQSQAYAAKSRERVRAWREANPERWRAVNRANSKAWRERQKRAA